MTDPNVLWLLGTMLDSDDAVQGMREENSMWLLFADIYYQKDEFS